MIKPIGCPDIDSCARMIYKKAHQVFRRVADHNKRWISLDDIISDGYLAALKIDHEYKFSHELYPPDQRASYAAYMYTGLDFHLDRRYITPFQMPKRTTSGIVELDAPVNPESSRTLELPTYQENVALKERDAIETLLMLCRRMNPEAAAYLVGGLLLHKWNGTGHKSKSAVQYLAEIRETVQKHGVTLSDLTPFLHDEKMQKKALTVISEAGSLGLGNQMAARLLECIKCTAQMPLSAIATGRYDVESMTCQSCLGELANAPESESCFGKLYDPDAVECTTHCRDKVACKSFQERKTMKSMTAAEEAELDELDEETEEEEEETDTASDETEEEEEEEEEQKSAKTAKKKKTAKPAKTAKKAKSKKSAKPAGEPPPAAVGAKWPFKEGSVMLWCFKKALDGIKRADLEAGLKRHRPDVKFSTMLGALRRDEKWKQRNPTHSWDLSEEGGRLKIHNIKYLGENKPKAAPAKKVASTSNGTTTKKKVAKKKK